MQKSTTWFGYTQMYVFDFDGTFVSCRERHTQLMSDIIGRDFAVYVNSFWTHKRAGMNNIDALMAVGFGSIASRSYAEQWKEKIEDETYLSRDKKIVDSALLGQLCKMGDVIVLTARERPENVRQQISNLSLTNLITDLIVVPPSDSVNKKERILRRLRPTL